MSFAGHVFDMISRMKANALRKRRPFDREVEASGPAIRPEYLRTSSEEDLAYWREKTLADRRRQRRRMGIAFIITAIAVLALLVLWR